MKRAACSAQVLVGRIARSAVLVGILAPCAPAPAAEMYAQAIGQPPEREAPKPPPSRPPPPVQPPPAEPPAPEPPTARAEPAAPAARGNLRTRIAIGAAIAVALAALGGNGGGGESTPTHETAPAP
ncbi:MAG TPA: hypothetical protein VF203_09165 [Burkholderiales bacterium]